MGSRANDPPSRHNVSTGWANTRPMLVMDRDGALRAMRLLRAGVPLPPTGQLDLARQVRTLDLRPACTVRFVLWNGEEQGMYGSAGYVRTHAAAPDRAGRRRVPNNRAPGPAPSPRTGGPPPSRG